jgi:hypothetical protein
METNLKLCTQSQNREKLIIREIAVLAVATALLFASQVALAFLPNIEMVSLLVIIYTLVFRRKTLYIIYAFAILQGVMYGFGLWWVTYLYIWTILHIITNVFYKNESPLFWAIVGGAYGLAFGALSAIPTIVIGGIGAGVAWWISGMMFDVVHGIGNFVVILILFKPLYLVMRGIANELTY